MGEYKKFSKELYNENNKIAIQTSSEFISQIFKYQILQQEQEAYSSHDFIVVDPHTKKNILIETEIKKVWEKSGQWQGWDTLDIPYRKNKSQAQLFIMINKNHNTLACMLMNDVKTSKIKQKRTIYTDSGTEQFFSVSLSKVLFFYKKNNAWERIKA